MTTLLDLPVQVGMVLENYSVTADSADGTFIFNTLDAEEGEPTDMLHIHSAALRPVAATLIARADALGVPSHPTLIRFPTPDPLQTIADTLESQIREGIEPSRSQIIATIATLRSYRRREVETVPTPGCVVVPIKMVPGSPVSREIV